ncbi:MAG TPA: hypothetical protein VFV08_05835 [Puia sp.]|nr:hypothetical protein [Puia sp.]
MSFSTLIGSIGVSLLLVAFLLNLFGILSQKNKGYIWLNILGAAFSCYASILINYLPFVILEAIWCLVAIAGFFRKKVGPKTATQPGHS